MKCDRNKLKDILNVSINALKQLERRNTLEKRLNENGYTLLNRHIENNKFIYEIEKDNLKHKINKLYGINKTDNFITYFNIRIKEEPKTVIEIADRANVTERTIIKWDNKLKDKRILIKDGYYYFKLDRITGVILQVSKEEYKSFWKNKAYINAFNALQLKYLQGELTLTELKLASGDLPVIISTIENKYYYKVKRYKVNINNQLYVDTKKIIQGVR
ncbi:UNVERIFIED_ORG: hypothetical protein B2H98_05355 [Clostridium botulinum]